MTTDTRPDRGGQALAIGLPTVNFLSFFAIAAVEFAVPFVAVSRLGASSIVIAALGICRFAPQVLLARTAARAVERYEQRTVMLVSELLRVAAFVLSALALTVAAAGLTIFALANVALACGSVLTAVATQVLVPAIVPDEALPQMYSRLGIAESSADAIAPFATGLALGAVGTSATFGIAAALALAACGLLLRIPRVRGPVGDEPVVTRSPATLRRGLRLNFAKSPLRTITIWAMSYNFGQCLIGALLLIALVRRTPITAAWYGVMQSVAVTFAVIGAAVAERLPRVLRSGLGTAVSGAGAVAAYAVIGFGAFVGGMTGLVLVLLGAIIDEFCSGVVLVRVQAYRARAVAPADRAAATAAYRAVNLTAVPAGYAVGGIMGLVLAPGGILLTVGLLMLLPAAMMFSRPIRAYT